MTHADFADLIDRYASRSLEPLEWQRHFATHYADSRLEEARRQIAEIATTTGDQLSPERLREIRAIAESLRVS